MSVVDLNGIKTQIKTNLDAVNTTTANSTDLSNGLSNSQRVLRVLKINPTRIPIQATWLPFVTMFIEGKSLEEDQIAGSPNTASRLSTVEIQVVGVVSNWNISDLDEDAADNDCEVLMGNIEAILAEDDTLSGAVKYQKVTGVQFHNANLDEGTHIRYGVLSMECLVEH